MQRVFAVISWGAAGTAWLARVLNSHPDIFCVHAANTYLQRFGISFGQGVEYINALTYVGNFYPVIGDVHGVNSNAIPELKTKFGDRFGYAFLVRDPMPRLLSEIALFHKLNFSSAHLDYLAQIAEAAGYKFLDLTLEQKHYLHAANMLNNIVQEECLGRIFRIEDLAKESATLLDLVQHLTGDSLRPTEGWARAALQIKALNRHRGDLLLDSWTLEAVQRCVKPEAWDAYERLGYPKPTGCARQL